MRKRKMRMAAGLLALLTLLASCGTAAPAASTATTGETPVATPPEERRVGSPMPGIPDYTLPAGASTDEIRAMAVKAMRDELTVQWYVDKSFSYLNGDGGEFNINSREVYAGLPYTQSGSGLLQWLQYYDFNTGKMSGVNGDIQGFLGNSCAASVMWGWSSVVTSIDWNTTYLMTPAHGCLPVGGYRVDPTLADYRQHTTRQIIEDNGEEAILQAYAAVLPADGLISVANEEASGSHAQMAIEPAHVVYNADGTVNREESYITIQDQHKGALKKDEPFVTTVDGQKVHYAGHVSQQMTFAKLLSGSYIPVTAAEFTGAKPYVVPSVSAEGTEGVESLADLQKITLSSDYKIITVRAVVTDGDTVLAESKKVLGRAEIENGTVSRYNLATLPTPNAGRKCEDGKTYGLKVEALLASGSAFTVLDTTFTFHK